MPKVTCNRVHIPETKNMVLMRWLCVRPSCCRHNPCDKINGMAMIPPNAVKQCWEKKDRGKISRDTFCLMSQRLNHHPHIKWSLHVCNTLNITVTSLWTTCKLGMAMVNSVKEKHKLFVWANATQDSCWIYKTNLHWLHHLQLYLKQMSPSGLCK